MSAFVRLRGAGGLLAVSLAAAPLDRPPPPGWREVPELAGGAPAEALRVWLHEGSAAAAPARRVVAALWDPASPAVTLRAVLAPAPRTVSQLAAQENRRVWAALNGGYFGGAQSFSLVVAAGQVLSPNVRQVSRPLEGATVSYFPTRAAWGLDAAGRPSAQWVYSVGPGTGVLHAYSEPSPNQAGRPPQPVPGPGFPEGGAPWPVAHAIGGSPMLVRDGAVRVTDAEELIEVNNASRRPRSAIGHRADGVVALVAAEGDQPGGPPGLTLRELAELLRELGCTAAVNLDGGGSTTMLLAGRPGVRPSEGLERAVMSAVLLVEAADPGRPAAAPVVRRAPLPLRLSPGGAGWLQVAAEGGGLGYQWTRDGMALPGATTPALRLAGMPAGSAAFAVTVTNPLGTVTAGPAVVTVGPGSPGELVNLSVRARAGSGEQQLVAGLAVRGGPRRLLARAVGPGLEPFGVDGTLADPFLELRGTDGRLVAENDDWAAGLGPVAAGAGAFPLTPGSRDAGLLAEPGPGTFLLATLVEAGGPAGEVLLEAYGLGGAGALVNLSSRARVAAGAGALTAGFVVGGDTAVTVLVRAVGPSLALFGVGEALAEPQLSLARGGEVIAENRGWAQAANAAAIREAAAQSGAFPISGMAADAALLVTLPPGPYTATLSTDGRSGGVGLIELYEVR